MIRSRVAGVVFGLAAGLLSYAMVDSIVLAVTVGGLYVIGTGLLVKHLRTLYRLAGVSGRGSWWALGFGVVVGLVLVVVQMFYRDISQTGAVRGADAIAPIPLNYALVLWLLIFGLALVAFNCGIGMALADANVTVDDSARHVR